MSVSRARERADMVAAQLRARGIRDPRVLDAFQRVPRHEFVPPELAGEAYEDGPLPIGQEQTISQPYIVALMTAMLDLGPGHRVLEIGTGSGYQTAVLSELSGEVYSVEVRPGLLESARATLERLGYDNIRFRSGDGARGWPEEAPFDRIVATACAREVPAPLVGQLACPGRFVLPLGGEDGKQQLVRLVRRPDGAMDREEGVPVRFVMMKGGATAS